MDMEVVHIDLLKMFMSIAVVSVVGLLLRLYKVLVMEPKRVRILLKKQGIDGPPPKFLLGNLSEMKKPRPTSSSLTTSTDSTQPLDHDWVANLYPCFDAWKKQYGETFVFSMGRTNILYVTNPDLVRKIMTHTSYDFGKPSYHRKEFGPLLGSNGILTANGAAWAVHRKILAPELFPEKVKGMADHMAKSADVLISSWNGLIERGGGIADINIVEDMRSFSADVTSRACFGSNFDEGTLISSKLKTLQEVTSDKLWTIGVPVLGNLPTETNKRIWGLEKEITDSIIKIVEARREKGDHHREHKDLLQMTIEGAEANEVRGQEAKDKFVVDNCKNILLAANEATSVRAAWCLMLLASSPEWQDRVRAEVLEVCGGRIPDHEMLRQMKQLTMVIQETLRLYPSGPAVAREALKDMKIGGIEVPKGLNFWFMVVTMQTDPEIWGPDAHIFNPERFSNGVAAALQQQQDAAQAFYFPFGFGPRVCVGQHLAMIELKMAVCLLVSNFTFTLSPNYLHSPALKLVITPEHGINLLVKKVVKN